MTLDQVKLAMICPFYRYHALCRFSYDKCCFTCNMICGQGDSLVPQLSKIMILYICHLQGDIEALTLQEHSLDGQIRLATSYLSS